jgi:two-component system sensor histidine kinase UhpB
MHASPSLLERLLQLMDQNLDFVEVQGSHAPRELLGRQYLETVHPADRRRAERAFARALHGTQPETVKLRYVRKDGTWRTILASAQNFVADPAVHAVLVLSRDVTAQCDAEASLALANAKAADLKEQLVGAADKQRRYLASELHDDVQQILVGLRMSMAPSRKFAADPLQSNLVDGWMHLVQTAIDHLHALSVVLRKPAFDGQGLPGAIRSYVDQLPLAGGQRVVFKADNTVGAPTPNVKLACFRIVQEALANAIKHSGGRHLLVSLKSASDRLTVSVRDDGGGFDVADAQARAGDAGSIGLSSMRERAALAGGRLEIDSSVGQGTTIRASFPIKRSIRPH